MSYINEILTGIQNLPSKDVNIAIAYLNDRDFNSLYELVDSALFKVEKYKSEHPDGNKYDNIDTEGLSDLKITLIDYIRLIEGIEEEVSQEQWVEYDIAEEDYE